MRGWIVAVVLLGTAPAVARPLELRAGALRARVEDPWRLVFEDSSGKTVLAEASAARLTRASSRRSIHLEPDDPPGGAIRGS